ncbi:hypothetical protein ACN4EK_27005 [Pantanalinema rosaneae CENA516]|uniref:hypothetical protein n=1 Tax=Pantanalinema rosaneae TaxID=1620701 RepID=UPI003D6F831C
MIDLKTAVKAAYEYFDSIQDMIGNQLQDLRLEEVELSDDRKFWLITLGFEAPARTKMPLGLEILGSIGITRFLGLTQKRLK